MLTLRPRGRTAFSVALLLVAASGAVARAQDAELPDRPTLTDYLRVAEARNAALEGEGRIWRAEEADVARAGSWPDPELGAELMDDDGTRLMEATLRQEIPWFGKPGLRETAARAGADRAREEYEDARLALRGDVTDAWAELVWLDDATRITRETLGLLVNLEAVARERYRVGEAGHHDVARVQIEAGRLENDVLSLEDRRGPAGARMNALLHRASDAPVPVTSAELPRAPDRETVRTSLLRDSRRLRAAQARIVRAEAERDLARRERWPDAMLGVGLRRTGEDEFSPMAMAGIRLPIFRGKYSGAVDRSEAELAAARAMRAGEEDALLAEAERALFDWRDADRRETLARDVLLPKAQESLESSVDAYRTGVGSFLDMIESLRTLLELRLDAESARADRGRAAARLGRITGTDWIEEGSR